MSIERGPAIDVRGLKKSFGSSMALDGVDLSVPHGQIHGFLGPNGAGKSTTIRVLLGLLHADEGTAQVFGMDSWSQSVDIHRRLAYVPGDVSLWPTLTGGEAIDLLTRLRGVREEPRRRDALLERFQLDPSKKIKAYSKGNRQKVALVAALTTDVELYIFDEPTSGLDPLMEAVFRDYVTEIRSRGGTVLLSSHILAEVEALCDRVSIIRQGRIVESGTLTELRHLSRSAVVVTTERPPPDLSGLPGVHNVSVDGTTLRCHVDGPAMGALLAAIVPAGVTSLTAHPPTLEELFLRHYGDTLPADEPAQDPASPTWWARRSHEHHHPSGWPTAEPAPGGHVTDRDRLAGPPCAAQGSALGAPVADRDGRPRRRVPCPASPSFIPLPNNGRRTALPLPATPPSSPCQGVGTTCPAWVGSLPGGSACSPQSSPH